MINVFEPCSLQVGDRNFYTFLENDALLSKDQWRRKQKDTFSSLNPDHACMRPKLSPKRLPHNKTGPEVVGEDDEEEDADSSAAASPAHHLTIPHAHHLNRKSDTEHDEWDTEDTGSFSDTASLSSNCSNSSQCEW